MWYMALYGIEVCLQKGLPHPKKINRKDILHVKKVFSLEIECPDNKYNAKSLTLEESCRNKMVE